MSIEYSILEELNFCRSNPTEFSSLLVQFRSYYEDKDLAIPNCPRLPTSEGPAGLAALGAALQLQPPAPELLWNEALYRVSQSENNQASKLHHFTQETFSQKELELTASKHCTWAGSILEVHSFGAAEPRDVLIKCLLSDGDASRFAFKTLMASELKFIGITFTNDSTCSNNPFASSVTFVLASEITEEKSAKAPLKKARAEEYVRVKEITLQDKIAEGQRNLRKIPGISQIELEEIKEFFDKVSSGHDGTISQEGLRTLFETTQFNNSAMFSVIKDLELDKLESIDFENFVGFISKNLQKDPSSMYSPILGNKSKITNELVSECKEMFDIIDHDKSGLIDADDIKNYLEQNESCGLQEIMSGLDVSQSEKLDFAGFLERISEYDASVSQFNELSLDAVSGLSPIKNFGKNSSCVDEGRPRFRGKALKSLPVQLAEQCKEVFQLLDLESKGKITAGVIKKQLIAENFKSDFPIFCSYFKYDLPDSQELTLSDLISLCPISS